MKVVHFRGGTISWSANIRNVLGSNCFFVGRLRHLTVAENVKSMERDNNLACEKRVDIV